MFSAKNSSGSPELLLFIYLFVTLGSTFSMGNIWYMEDMEDMEDMSVRPSASLIATDYQLEARSEGRHRLFRQKR